MAIGAAPGCLCFYTQNASWVSKTDVSPRWGANSHVAGGRFLPFYAQNALFSKSAWYLRYFGACLFGGAKTYANMHQIVACGQFAW